MACTSHHARGTHLCPPRTPATYVVARVDWQVIPDYEVLLARLEERLGTSLNVVLLDAIPPESAEAARADCGTSVHVLLLSCSSS